MSMKRFALALLVAPLLFTGCATVITNLTPRQYTRNADGLYTFECQWDSRHQVVDASFKPYVVIGTNFLPMQRVGVVANRWEAQIPVPADETLLHYHYKVDYEYLGVGKNSVGSKRSAPYTLEVKGK